VEGRIVHLAVEAVTTLGTTALIMRGPLAAAPSREWHAPIWSALRPAIAEIAAVSFVVNLLALASPLFMMVVVNRLAGRAPLEPTLSLIAGLAAGLLAVYALDLVLRLARGWLSARARARLDTLMSRQVVHHLMRLPYRHFERNPVGAIAERLRQLAVLRGLFAGPPPALVI